MIPAGLAFTLAYVPAKLAAVDTTRALLEGLSRDNGVSSEPKLKHAVEFARKATQIERKIAAEEVQVAIRKAAAAGVVLPALPETAEAWPAWREALEIAIGANVDEGGRLGLGLGQRAFDLMFAWCRAERLAYLRAAHADHPVLVDQATRRVPEVAAAWAELDLAVKASGRPLLEVRRESLADWITHAPAPDAVKNIGSSSSFAKMVDWIKLFDTIVANFARDLDVPVDAPPSRPASAEEEQLVAAIIANPDDDALRHRFADLAAERGDPHAELVRVQFAELATGDTSHLTRARELVHSHPEWSAPLTALGARDVKFTRGFPSEITIDLDPLLANANELFSLAPITTLRVRGGLAGRGAELASLPQLVKLTVLDLADQRFGDADFEALVKSSRLTRIRTLILHQNEISARGVDALAAATHTMPALTSVDLQLNPADPTDEAHFYNETDQEYLPTPEGKALETKYGRLRWLHPGDK